MTKANGNAAPTRLFVRGVTYLESHGKRLHEDALLLAAALLLCSFYCMEGHRLDFSSKDPAQIYALIQAFPGFLQRQATMFFVLGMELVRRALAVVMLVTAAGLAFSNGVRRKRGFLFFSAAYFLLPQLVILAFERLRPGGKLLKVAYQAAQVLIDWPFRSLTQWQQYRFGLSQAAVTNLTLLLIALAFALGFAAKAAQRRLTRPSAH